MNDSTSMLHELTVAFQKMGPQLLEYLPRIITAVLVLVIGWLVARLLRMVIVRAISRLDQFWQRLIAKRGLRQLQPRQPPTRVVGELVFWLLMLIFVTLAADILGLAIFSTWFKEVISYIPLVAAGLLIVLVGFVVSSLVRDLVTSAADSAGLSHGDLLGRTGQIIILFTTIIIGIEQIGIDVAFITVVVGIILAAVMGSIALAFGMGARTHVSNIIAANQLRTIYQIGDKVKIDDIEGRIVDITVSRVIIESTNGTVDVPAKIFDEQVTMIIEKGI